MMAQQWIRFNRNELNKPVYERINGSKVQVMLSPFDIPEAAQKIQTENAISIKFKYMGGDEATREEKVDQGVIFTLGKKSNKLYKIEIGMDALDGNNGLNLELYIRVSDSIAHYQKSHKNLRSRSFDAIKNAMQIPQGHQLLAMA